MKIYQIIVLSARLFGHHIDYCRRYYPEEPVVNGKERIGPKKHVKEPKKVFVQARDGRLHQCNDADTSNVNKEGINSKEPQENTHLEKEKNAEEEIMNRTTDPVVDLVESLRQQDKQLEDELNAQMDKGKIIASPSSVSSTQGYFVDATQRHDDFLSTDDEVQSKEEQLVTTPERVIKDMAFLQKSWANMTENEYAEARLLASLKNEPAVAEDNEVDQEGFQIMMSKSKKKAQKKLKNLSRDTYANRSKVTSKPFK